MKFLKPLSIFLLFSLITTSPIVIELYNSNSQRMEMNSNFDNTFPLGEVDTIDAFNEYSFENSNLNSNENLEQNSSLSKSSMKVYEYKKAGWWIFSYWKSTYMGEFKYMHNATNSLFSSMKVSQAHSYYFSPSHNYPTLIVSAAPFLSNNSVSSFTRSAIVIQYGNVKYGGTWGMFGSWFWSSKIAHITAYGKE